MTRKSKKKRLQIIHPHCAGIDIGSREHWVAVDPDIVTDPVRCFSSNSKYGSPLNFQSITDIL